MADKNEYLEQYNEKLYLNNPIMRGFIFQNTFLNFILMDEEISKNNMEKHLKINICEILLFCIQLRNDFLLSNFVSWFSKKVLPVKGLNQEIMKNIINDGIYSILPKVLKCGVETIDQVIQLKEELSIYNLMEYFEDKLKIFFQKNILRIEKQNEKSKNFKIYTGKDEIPDLDKILTGEINEANNVTKNILPSLIMSFYLTDDMEFENKLLEVIFQSFNQRYILRKNIQELNLLLEDDEIQLNKFLDINITGIKSNFEELEVYLISSSSETQLFSKFLENLLDQMETIKKLLSLTEKEKNLEYKNFKIFTYILFRNKNLLKNKQGICFFYKIHEILLKALESFRKNSKKLFEKTNTKNNRFEELFQIAFQILRLIIEKNNEYKKILFEHINLFIHQVDLNLGQIELICEIFRNNNDLLSKIDNEFLLKFKNIICLFGQKSRFLEIFLTIQKNEDDFLISNQILVLDFFFDNFLNENDHLFFSEIFFVERSLNEGIDEKNEKNKANQTDMFEILDYTIKLLEVYFSKFL